MLVCGKLLTETITFGNQNPDFVKKNAYLTRLILLLAERFCIFVAETEIHFLVLDFC